MLIDNHIFPTDLLVYRSAIYPQWKTFKYGLGGRLAKILRDTSKEINDRATADADQISLSKQFTLNDNDALISFSMLQLGHNNLYFL